MSKNKKLIFRKLQLIHTKDVIFGLSGLKLPETN